MSNNENEIRRIVEIKPREVLSRRVTADNIRSLIDELSQHVGKFSNFTVWRFGHDDRLEFPANRVHEAITRYDVQRIRGRAYAGQTEDADIILEIDLWAGGHVRNWDWLFSVEGSKPVVDQLLAIVEDHYQRWPLTWHRFFHIPWVFLLVSGFLLVPAIGSVFRAVTEPTVGKLAAAIVVIYLWLLSVLIFSSAGSLAPFIWFDRPGGIIAGRRSWLPRFSLFAVVALAGSLITNLVWQALSD